MEQYRFHTVYVNKTRTEGIADTVGFFSEQNKTIGVSNQEAATNAELYLIEAIAKPSPTASFLSIGDRKLQKISNLEVLVTTF